MSEIAMKITGEDKNAQAALARLEAKVLSLQEKIKGVGTASRRSNEDMGTSIVGAVAGYFTVGVAIGAVKKGIDLLDASTQTWIANAREAIGVADKLVPALRPLLSGGGRVPTEETMKIVAGAGIRDRPGAYNVADALADVLAGDTAAANRELKEVLDVVQLGEVPLSAIPELAKAGAFKDRDIGETIRQVHVLTERFRVDPETIARTFALQERIGPAEEALAVTGVMQQRLPGRKAIGGIEGVLEALGPEADEKLQRKFKRMGVRPDQTLLEQLERFGGLGLDTTEEFQKAGVKSAATAQNLTFLVQDLDKIQAATADLLGPAVTEGAIIGQIGRMEKESPFVREERERVTLEAEFEKETVFGATARIQAAEDRKLQAMGLALKKQGIEGGFGADFIDEQGRAMPTVNPFKLFARILSGGGARATLPDEVLTDRWLERFKEGGTQPNPLAIDYRDALLRLNAAAQSLENATRNMHGGPAMVPR